MSRAARNKPKTAAGKGVDSIGLLCHYCLRKPELVGGAAIYPHRPDLYEKKFYLCRPCDAYVRCHPKTAEPLGRLANAELQKAKQAAHVVFDPKWKGGKQKRKEAYLWRAAQLGTDFKDCHISMFGVETCRRVVDICEA